MSRSLSTLQALVLGLAVASSLAFAGAGLFAVGGRQGLWGRQFHIRAGFRSIQGVEVGTRVRVLGRDAGEVDRIDLPSQPTGQVVLQLRLDGAVCSLVRADAVAAIAAEGLIGGKVVDIDPGSDATEAVRDDALIRSKFNPGVTEVLAQIGVTLQGLQDGAGSLGKLVKDETAYRELVELLRKSRGTLVSLKQDVEAMKGLPLIRGYVQDPQRDLLRPDCRRYRQWFAEADLFEDGQAILTEGGKERLDGLAPWFQELKIKGSEIVVASFARPTDNPEIARTLTQKRSEVACRYLTEHYSIHKTGLLSWRKVTPLGCGADPSPVAESEPMPAARVEVVVFVPQG